ncbi:hypothetical protein [Desulfosporosinus sp. Sb-LF]|uniref:hypothetical protein n=1 Tax=Desulfosporosinus sp. Sb-LF TaxID=2560027 RepID=UPI0013052800|nr:hypothetical protein [Desulfosporosinus sp. Sb-LF]
MSHKDEATREDLASELEELKDKYSKLEQAYNVLLNQNTQDQSFGLLHTQRQQNQIT